MSKATKIFATILPTFRNRESFPAYERTLEEQYVQTLMTNTLANTFYADQTQLLMEANEIHDQMLKKDPNFAAKAIVYARNEGYMRIQPIYGLAKLSSVRPELFAEIFSKVIRIPSDLFDFMTILESMGRGQGGRAIKRAVKLFLREVSEYWAMKYNGRGRGFNLADVISTAHPIAKDPTQEALFRYLLNKEADLSLILQIQAMEKLKSAETDSERIHWITAGKLTYEVVTGVIQPSKAVWEAILYQMPTFALLRHLNALDRAGVLEGNQDYIAARLTDQIALQKAKILPFRFVNAFHHVNAPVIKDALREAVDITFRNVPAVEGKTAIFLDISGSMQGDLLEIGSVFAYALYKKTRGHGLFWLFNTEVIDAKPSLYDSILTQASQIKAGGGTDTGAPIKELIARKRKVDNIIIITDEQQNSGSHFYSELARYRKAVNREVIAFIIDIAPYRSVMVPPQDPNTYYIYGWSDTILQYIANMTQGYAGMVDSIKATEFD
ncbi:TROVE domain-containing protein [Paenibacillus psychroresistens]|uniref:TROVE domain-containing protein n=1 Tax=Paenibacillus psychroresistens TaxID=1778678 RepID=A0A6B8RCR2_9BACL|nr:TROVE domain-containing protein [Paenibacillus psychroresistens]QGQ94261.1 TROVE domain-containing protein [Paenibacillus psychroresistens]